MKNLIISKLTRFSHYDKNSYNHFMFVNRVFKL